MADNTYKLELTLSNGTKINAGTFIAPQGQKGDKGEKGDTGAKGETGAQGIQGVQGEQGVSVTGATVTPV